MTSAEQDLVVFLVGAAVYPLAAYIQQRGLTGRVLAPNRRRLFAYHTPIVWIVCAMCLWGDSIAHRFNWMWAPIALGLALATGWILLVRSLGICYLSNEERVAGWRRHLSARQLIVGAWALACIIGAIIVVGRG